jgi:hypothetical protein
MSNRSSQSHSTRRPSRGPAKRAEGLDPEITARPRSVSDEIAREDPTVDQGLSVDPEDLGSRYLSEAVEQGDFSSDPPAEAQASLFEPPAGDEPLVGPNFETERSIWEQTVDLTLQTGGAARELRGPTFVAGDPLEERSREAIEEIKTAPVDIEPSTTREVSLFDRQGSEGDETIESVRETRSEARGAPPRESSEQALAWLRTTSARVARSMLMGAASALRSLARWLARGDGRPMSADVT